MNHKFKDNLKKIRKEHNLSQEQLAEELGVSRQAISKWESGAAYPEMDKILSLCEKFHLNIDDLLNKDIKEVKGEEETKNNMNKYIEDFFKYITDTITLFSNMKLKSKIKCLLEQAVIAFILIVVFSIIFLIIGNLVNSIFHPILPGVLYYNLYRFVEGIYLLVALLLGIFIMFRIFKSRYLDYYEQLIEETNKDNPQETVEKSKKFEVKPVEEKIIIRDPKHSEYRFFNAVYKFMIIGIKLCALWLEVLLCSGLFCIAIGIVMSFLIMKTGTFFIGILIALIAAGIMDSVVILLIFNFIFDRKSDKKIMIWTFIISTILLGIGCGLAFIGILDFDMEEEQQSIKTESIELVMKENSFLDYDNIEYVVESRDNIRVEYEIYNNSTAQVHENRDGSICFFIHYENEFETLKYVIKKLNSKKIVQYGYGITNIKVYASEENINRMKQNVKDYYDTYIRYQEQLEEYEDKIEELHDEYEDRIQELTEEYESRIEDLEEELDECKYSNE